MAALDEVSMRSRTRRELLAEFLRLGVCGAAGATWGGCAPRETPPIPGELVGPDFARGHTLRDSPAPPRPADDRWETWPVVIVGGGVAGLAAGRRLQQQRLPFVLLELEQEAGGTARSGTTRGEAIAFPWGAHYLPTPLADNRPLIELLDQLGLVEGTDETGHPVFAEQHLCRDPQERLFFKGHWSEGLYLHDGASAEDLRQLRRFEALVDGWIAWRDARGRRAFAVPRSRSSDDPEVTRLDDISMAEWLAAQRLDSPRLLWLIDYGCRDDYGLTLDQTSAWAGLFYHAARVRAPGAESQSLLTWPEGNGRLVRELRRGWEASIRLGEMVVDIAPPAEPGGELELVSLDASGTPRGWRARRVIFAAPQFVARRVLRPWREAPPQHVSDFEYGSWVVANIALRDRPLSRGFPMAWDNVFYDSPSLGYVVATHQSDRDRGPTVWTYYYPLCAERPSEARQRLLGTGQQEWAEIAISELERGHPGVRRLVERVDVMRWGHAMVRPRPGFLWGSSRERANQTYRGVHFAHSDLSGLPLFEEAFEQGNLAASRVVAELSGVEAPG